MTIEESAEIIEGDMAEGAGQESLDLLSKSEQKKAAILRRIHKTCRALSFIFGGLAGADLVAMKGEELAGKKFEREHANEYYSEAAYTQSAAQLKVVYGNTYETMIAPVFELERMKFDL